MSIFRKCFGGSKNLESAIKDIENLFKEIQDADFSLKTVSREKVENFADDFKKELDTKIKVFNTQFASAKDGESKGVSPDRMQEFHAEIVEFHKWASQGNRASSAFLSDLVTMAKTTNIEGQKSVTGESKHAAPRPGKSNGNGWD